MPIERHIDDRASTRLFDLRDTGGDATICPDRVLLRYVQSELYGMGRHSTAHLYAVPVLAGFDAVRNCWRCRGSKDDCKAWRRLRKSVGVLRQECGRYAKGVDGLSDATGAGRR